MSLTEMQARDYDERGRFVAQSFYGEIEKISRASGYIDDAARFVSRLGHEQNAYKKLQNQAGGTFRAAGGEEMKGRGGLWSGLQRATSTSGAALGKGWGARRGALNATTKRIYGLQDDVQAHRSEMLRIIKGSDDAAERATAQRAIDVLDSGGRGRQPKLPNPPKQPSPPKEGLFSRTAKLTGYGAMGAGAVYGGTKYYQHRKKKQQMQAMGY